MESKDVFKSLNHFDDISRDVKTLVDLFPKNIISHITTANQLEEIRKKYAFSLDENQELQSKLQEQLKLNEDLKAKLNKSRKYVDQLKKDIKKAREEKDHISEVFTWANDFIQRNLPESIRKKEIHEQYDECVEQVLDNLSTIQEQDITGDLVADLSYTRDEDDFFDTSIRKRRAARNLSPDRVEVKKMKPSEEIISPRSKLRSKYMNDDGDKLVATTTVTIENGNVHASSILESFSRKSAKKSISLENLLVDDANNAFIKRSLSSESLNTEMTDAKTCSEAASSPCSMNNINTRPHKFGHQKAMIRKEICNGCYKKIGFSAAGFKCKSCKSVCHILCKHKVPLPCVPPAFTPNKEIIVGNGTIADYAPVDPPMIPAIVIHCIKEIENRGMHDIGLYRIPGSKSQVETLRDKFIKGKGIPNLSFEDTNVICGCLKSFFKNLKEPLITNSNRDLFIKASELNDIEDKKTRMLELIRDLPPANRDTLCYLILHLQRVADNRDNLMDFLNLAKVLGPTIIGESGTTYDQMFAETAYAINVMRDLILIPPDDLIDLFKKNENFMPVDLKKTPSSNSLRNFFYTPKTDNRRKPRKKIFVNT